MASTTKQRLLDGAMTALREHGIAGVSARTIAAAAGLNQALVFYHFGSVDDLLSAACQANTAERVEHYAERFARVGSLRELLEVGRSLHAQELRLGNVSVLAQLLAGAQNDAKLAAPIAASLQLWIDQIESVLQRLLAGSPFAEVADIPGLARAVSAAFVGLELYEGVDEAGAQRAIAALEQLAVLVEVVDDLGPVARRALRARVSRASARRATKARPAAEPRRSPGR
jgi:AcrR family transcriptional regulator